MDDHERRITHLEEDGHDQALAIADLQTVVMGPPPSRSNGIRGDLHLLKTAFYKDREARAKEGSEVKAASISMRGVVLAAAIPSALSALVTILVTLLARGAK